MALWFARAVALHCMLCFAQVAWADDATTTTYGPAKGTLIIIGGGNAEGTGIMERFIQLGGGPNGKFVIVPAAGGNRNADGSIKNYDEQRVIAPWLRRGLK